jgi:hypothetical protein
MTVLGLIESIDGRPFTYLEEVAELNHPRNEPATFEISVEFPAGVYVLNLGVSDGRSKSAGTRRMRLSESNSRHR